MQLHCHSELKTQIVLMSAPRKLDFPSDAAEAGGTWAFTLHTWLWEALISLLLEVVDTQTRLFRYLRYFG